MVTAEPSNPIALNNLSYRLANANNSDEALKFAQKAFELNHGHLLAVSYLKPDSFGDGHPASSKLNVLEALIDRVLDGLKRHPELAEDTAFIITFDEGGGYYDSAFMQPIDFFGDGPRIPLIIVSPFTKGGHVSHTYSDHVSILKFIERNWELRPLTHRSRDNFPNPVSLEFNRYVPLNSPALGDLFDLFDFEHCDRGGNGDR